MTSNKIIELRKQQFNIDNDIKKDKEFTNAVANDLKNNSDLLDEINDNPFLLIELVFQLRDKNGILCPFFLNKEQKNFLDYFTSLYKEYIAGKRDNIRIWVLKSRQQGFTQLITAIQMCLLLTRTGFRGATVAHLDTSTRNIFESKAKAMYNLIPRQLVYALKKSNAREIEIEQTDSNWLVYTAGSKDSARSYTFEFVHASEFAFWKNVLENKASIMSAMAPKSIFIGETTANGFNEFYDDWVDATKGDSGFNIYFSHWYNQDEYVNNFETENIKEELIEALNKGVRFGTVDEESIKFFEMLRKSQGLDYKQVYWAINKKKELKGLFEQEYPSTPEQAFLTSGTPYFDTSLIHTTIQEVNHIKPLDNIRNEILIFEKVKEGRQYVIGSDVAEGLEDGDNSTFVILDRVTKKTVAVYQGKIQYNEFARLLFKYATIYNRALLGVERNNHGHATLTTLNEELRYKNLYTMIKREKKGTRIQDSERLGWQTTEQSKFLMLDELDTAIRNNDIDIIDTRILNELLSVQKEDGKVKVNGKDLVVATAIAYQMLKFKSKSIGIDIGGRIYGA